MERRVVEVFFYGLFMDQELVRSTGAEPVDVRAAVVRGFELRIGARAALVPNPAASVHGLLMKLSHADLERLYADPSVRAYRPEPLLAALPDGTAVPALCYNLPEPPLPEERNPDYADRLRSLARRVGLPDDYIASLR